MIKIKSKSFLGLKYDIVGYEKIGQLRIPFTRLVPSLRYGNIRFNIGEDQFYIAVPLKGEQRMGFLASGYILMQGDSEIASAEFLTGGSEDPFKINWNSKSIMFSKNRRKAQIYINNHLLGSVYYNYGQKNEGVIDVGEKLPIELQVFSYFAYKKYAEVSLDI